MSGYEQKVGEFAGKIGGIGFAVAGIIGSISGGAVSSGRPEQAR